MQEAFYRGRGYPMGELGGSASTGRDSKLEDLFAPDPSLDDSTVAGAKGDDQKISINDGSLQGSSKDQEHGSQDWLVWDPNYDLDVSPAKAGGVGDEREEVGIHSGISSGVDFPANGPEQEEWPDGTKDASDLMALVPLETAGKEGLQHDSNETDAGTQEVGFQNSSLFNAPLPPPSQPPSSPPEYLAQDSLCPSSHSCKVYTLLRLV